MRMRMRMTGERNDGVSVREGAAVRPYEHGEGEGVLRPAEWMHQCCRGKRAPKSADGGRVCNGMHAPSGSETEEAPSLRP